MKFTRKVLTFNVIDFTTFLIFSSERERLSFAKRIKYYNKIVLSDGFLTQNENTSVEDWMRCGIPAADYYYNDDYLQWLGWQLKKMVCFSMQQQTIIIMRTGIRLGAVHCGGR